MIVLKNGIEHANGTHEGASVLISCRYDREAFEEVARDGCLAGAGRKCDLTEPECPGHAGPESSDVCSLLPTVFHTQGTKDFISRRAPLKGSVVPSSPAQVRGMGRSPIPAETSLCSAGARWPGRGAEQRTAFWSLPYTTSCVCSWKDDPWQLQANFPGT